MSLNLALKEINSELEGHLGVSAKYLKDGREADVNGSMLFPTASVFKVPLLIEMYRQIDQGKIDLNEKFLLKEEHKVPGSGILKELGEGLSVSVSDLVTLMMIVSDNTATDILLEKVGKDNVNKMLAEFSFEKTRVVVDCRDILFDLVGLNDLPDERKTLKLYNETATIREVKGSWSLGTDRNNVTTPREMNRLLELIVRHEAASVDSCNAMLETMSKCQTGQYRIPKYLPSRDVKIIHKTGSLPGIRNDVGIVSRVDDTESYIISCFTKNAGNVYSAEEAIAKASFRVFETMQ